MEDLLELVTHGFFQMLRLGLCHSTAGEVEDFLTET